ncbi:MAG: LysR family transcriptional regulator [Ideonella sp.]|nr:LysR family transcriptional regulator [Ideonella sp.]
MDLKQIETFVRVAEHGSFSRASGVLRIAQPALSRQVRALETELRQRLFDRNGRGVTLTAAGRRLFAHGVGILQQVERARLDLEEHRGAPVGRLSLGLPPSVSRTLTAPLVAAFRERFPKAQLSVVEGLSTYMIEWLAQGRIDAAVVYQVTAPASVDLVPLAQEGLHLVTAAAGEARRRSASPRPVSLAQLAEHDLVIPSRPHSIRMLVEAELAAIGRKPKVALEIESVPAILDLVATLPLAAVLPLNALRDSRHAARLHARAIRRADGRSPLQARLWLATSSQRPSGPLLDQGLALLRQTTEGLWAGFGAAD